MSAAALNHALRLAYDELFRAVAEANPERIGTASLRVRYYARRLAELAP